jgi:hypothetical protein
MTRARLVEAGLSLEWLQAQIPGGSHAELVEFALHHATLYGSLASNQSLPKKSPESQTWFAEAKAQNLKLVAGEVPELADECNRQIKALGF